MSPASRIIPGVPGPNIPALALLLGLTVACSSGLRPLRAGESASVPAAGLAHDRDLTRGVLTYAVAFADDHTLVSVELETAFALVVRDLAAGESVETLRAPLGPAEYDIDDLAISHDHELAWVTSRAGTVRAIALRGGETRVTWHLGSGATAVALTPDGQYIALGTEDGIICLRRLTDQALLQCVAAHEDRISELTFDRTSSQLASSSWDGRVVLWQVPTLATRASLEIAGSANGVAFDPSGRRIAIATSTRIPRRTPEIDRREQRGDAKDTDDAVILWSLNEGDDGAQGSQASLRGHRGPVTRVAWTPDGTGLLSVSWDRTVTMWDTRIDARTAVVARVEGFSALIRDLAIDRRGSLVAVGAWTRSLDARSSTLLHLLYPTNQDPDVDE